MLGTNIGNYAVTAAIGEGGMGSVYLAEHAILGRRAAVKVLRPELSSNGDIVARFFNEARALTAIRHPSIVEVLDFGYMPDGSAYLVMEYLDGESLGARCRRLHKLDPRHALVLVRQIAGALSAAHERGVVHRDLKPENIFLVPDPEVAGGERIKVLDFGIAKLAEPGNHARTQTGSMLGTPTYMSPEQCRGAGSVDARADLYALGCVLFEMLCGQPPFTADGMGEVIAHHLYFPPPAPRSLTPALPEGVEHLVLWLLQKDPAARPQSARDLVDAIDRLGVAATATPPPAYAQPTRMMPGTPPPSTPAPPMPSPSTSAADRPTAQTPAGAIAMPAPPAAITPSGAMAGAPASAPAVSARAASVPAPARSASSRGSMAAPITTLSGAAGSSGHAMRSQRARARPRWVVPLAAASLVALGAAIAIVVGRIERANRTHDPETASSPSTVVAVPLDPAPARPAPSDPAGAGAPTETAVHPAGSSAGKPVDSPAIARIAIAIDSVPRGASVLVDGKAIGTTPFEESLEPTAGQRVYTLQKSGYEPTTVTLAGDRPRSERVTLKKKNRPARGSAEGVGDKGVNPFD
ncbi:MAG TPA: protein kinase [Kofleriaceae bacterium]